LKPRFFTYLFCGIIFATLAGGLGGSFQPARILIALIGFAALLLGRKTTRAMPLIRQAMAMAGILVLLGLVSLSWTADVLGGVGMLLAVLVGSISLYIISVSDLSISGARLLIWAWVATVAFSMPIAYYEIATGNHSQLAFESRNAGGDFGEFPFAAILFGNYNDYSTWLCLAFPITMTAFLQVKSNYAKSAITFLNILIVGVIFVNTSRASLAFAAIVIIVYAIRFNSFRNYAAIIISATVPILFIRYQFEILNIYSFALYRFEVLGETDESYIQRLGLIEGGVRAIIESLGLGIGLGGFDEYVNDNYPYLIPNPHNIFLEIGVNFGAIPLLVFLGLLVRLFFSGFLQKQIPDSFRFAVMMGAISVPIIGSVPSQAIVYVYWWVWLATMVAIASANVCPISREKDPKMVSPGPFSSRAPK
jgi:hypothetical protein